MTLKSAARALFATYWTGGLLDDVPIVYLDNEVKDNADARVEFSIVEAYSKYLGTRRNGTMKYGNIRALLSVPAGTGEEVADEAEAAIKNFSMQETSGAGYVLRVRPYTRNDLGENEENGFTEWAFDCPFEYYEAASA